MFRKLSESHTQDTEKCCQLNKISLLKSSNEDASSEQPQEEKKTYSVQRNKDVGLSAEMMSISQSSDSHFFNILKEKEIVPGMVTP